MENIKEQKSGGNFIVGNCLGVVLPGGLFRGNCPGGNVRGIIVVGGDFMGAIVRMGSCPGVNVQIP